MMSTSTALLPRLARSEWRLRLPVAPPLVVAFFVGDVAVALAALAGFLAGEGGSPSLLKVGAESNLPTWFSSSQLLVIGLLLAALALRDVRLRHARTWALALVPLLFIFLSLDETAMLHERLGDWIEASTGLGARLRTGPWMLVYVPAAGVAALAAGWAFRPYLRGRRDVLALFGAGLILFGVAAVGFEFAGNFVGAGSLGQKALGFAEEVGEMVAATLLLWGSAALLRHEGVRLDPGVPRG